MELMVIKGFFFLSMCLLSSRDDKNNNIDQKWGIIAWIPGKNAPS